MSQIITATFEDGILKPDEKLDLPPGTRVRLTVERLEGLVGVAPEASQQA